ncbi:hypothetical protein [Legionella feeleii]|uniref:Uncharacterized protein n=1 Tax=Legionella feeleii TaxID=453 RepID=A0A0W0TMP4_9GAMM|nr:hypothetical protein [Legionella feeleii]KTC96857.1 hypothetical protein Lfee_1769 [Legionella feeleii]SPX60909.1 Uncharacterised protein [Legionella feeleii]
MSTRRRNRGQPVNPLQINVLADLPAIPNSMEADPPAAASAEPLTDLPALAEGEIAVDNASGDFFIALCQDSIHSFVMLGIMQDNKPKILARVGKTNAVDKDYGGNFGSQCKLAMKQLFSQAEAELRKESLHPYGKISYAAYAISYNQYLQFTKLMALVHRKEADGKRSEAIRCYLPAREVGGTSILQFREIIQQDEFGPENTEQERRIVASTHNLKITNTCRHTAIELIAYVLGINKLRDNISRFFFWGLPLATTFTGGDPADPFYVFPLPPVAYRAGKEKTALLTKIYTRMEALLTKAPYEQNTRDKFKALKELYIEQAGFSSNDNITDALISIHRWRATYKDVISQLRQQSFLGKMLTRKSSTEAMADEIESEFTSIARRASSSLI